jgi:hypothetical protein
MAVAEPILKKITKMILWTSVPNLLQTGRKMYITRAEFHLLLEG